MDTVKAVINLKEGTLQLEGPQQFVEKYLDQYNSMIQSWKTFSSLPPEAKTKDEKEVTPKRTRAVRPKAGPACGEKISELIGEGFFKEQRTREEVTKKLLEKGIRYDSSLISATLNNFFRSGKIEKTGVGRNAKYYSKV
jgi:hypothetical protein